MGLKKYLLTDKRAETISADAFMSDFIAGGSKADKDDKGPRVGPEPKKNQLIFAGILIRIIENRKLKKNRKHSKML